MHGSKRSDTLEDRIKLQFPALFITLLSVLIGLVLADMVAEARSRIVLWPVTLETLRSWGQLSAHCSSAVTAWIIYSHIGISRERTPLLADSIVAFVVPMTLLLAMTLIGRTEIWPWFYYAAASLIVSLLTTKWLLHLSRDVPELARLNRLLDRRGYTAIFLVGIPTYLLAGWLDQNGMVPLAGQVAMTLAPLPTALFAAFLFLQEWRAAIAGK